MRVLLLASDHRLGQRLAQAFVAEGIAVVKATTLQAAISAAQRASVDCFILDFQTRRQNAIPAIRKLRKSGMMAPIIMVNVCDNPDERVRTMEAGADECLCEPLSIKELLMRVRIMLHRAAYTKAAKTCTEEMYGLTRAEQRLALLLMQGKSIERAATELHVSQNTVRSQLKSIFQKTGARRQAELVWLLLTSHVSAEKRAGEQATDKSTTPGHVKEAK